MTPEQQQRINRRIAEAHPTAKVRDGVYNYRAYLMYRLGDHKFGMKDEDGNIVVEGRTMKELKKQVDLWEDTTNE